MKTLAYRRVSTDKQELDRQTWVIETWAAMAGAPISDWLEDAGISGRASAVKGAAAERGKDMEYYAALCLQNYLQGESLIERPGFLLLLKAVADGQYQRVVVADITRLSRDLIELLLLERQLRRMGCALVAVASGTGAIDTSTAAGWMLYVMQAMWAELEARLISGRTISSLKAKVAAGIKLGRPPAGWMKGPRGADGSPGQYVPDRAVWDRMLRLVALKEAGCTGEECAQVLGFASEKVVRTWLASWARRSAPGFSAPAEMCQWQGLAEWAKTENGRFRSNLLPVGSGK